MRFLVVAVLHLLISNVKSVPQPQTEINDNIGVVASLADVNVAVSDVTANLIVDLNLGGAPVTNLITTADATVATLAASTDSTDATATTVETTTSSAQPTNLNVIDPLLLTDINSMFTQTELMFPSLIAPGSYSNFFYSMLRDSVDPNCVINKYQDFNMTDQINVRRLGIIDTELRTIYLRLMELVPNLTSLRGVVAETNTRIGQLMSMVMLSFYNAAISCSGKFIPFLNYSFDLLMSHGNLVRAIMTDAAFGPYNQMIICANNYASQNNLFDAQALNLTFAIPDAQRADCDRMITNARNFTRSYKDGFLSFSMIPSDRACFEQTFQDCEDFLLRHMLLTQVNVNESMIRDERANFVSDTQTILDNFFTCTTNVMATS